jgi:hypothetical protein
LNAGRLNSSQPLRSGIWLMPTDDSVVRDRTGPDT